MTWIPSSKYYSCSGCKARYLRFFDRFQLKVKMGGRKSKNTNRKIAIVAVGIFLTVYVCYRIVIILYESAGPGNQ